MKTLTGLGLVAAYLLILPLAILASLNTIAEHAQGFSFYIPHNVWTYLSVYGVALLFARGK